jgi:L-asparaginase
MAKGGICLPRVHLFALGGTIASVPLSAGGVAPSLTAEEIVRAAGVDEAIDVSASNFRQMPSGDLTTDDMLMLAEAIEDKARSGIDGVVVTQGTDTIEETSFALDLLVQSDIPVVVTGAMRHPKLSGSDGPANVSAAVAVAASAMARGLGTLVVFNDEIHAARFVQKRHTQSPSAFISPTGPIGWVAERKPYILVRLKRAPELPRPIATNPGNLSALYKVVMGDDGRMLEKLPSLGYKGLVLEALGGGHVPAKMVPIVAELARQMPVVLSSRTRNGRVLRETYGFSGSEMDLFARGVIDGSWLDGVKLRMLLELLLRAGVGRGGVQEYIHTFDVNNL